MKRKKLEALLREWQKVLGLQDWDVEIFFVPTESIDKEAGIVEYYPPLKKAYIKISDPKTLVEDEIFPFGLEHTIVHELLHLHAEPFDTFEEGTHEYKALEVMINKTAKALVQMKEEKKIKERYSDAEVRPHMFVDSEDVFKGKGK